MRFISFHLIIYKIGILALKIVWVGNQKSLRLLLSFFISARAGICRNSVCIMIKWFPVRIYLGEQFMLTVMFFMCFFTLTTQLCIEVVKNIKVSVNLWSVLGHFY